MTKKLESYVRMMNFSELQNAKEHLNDLATFFQNEMPLNEEIITNFLKQATRTKTEICKTIDSCIGSVEKLQDGKFCAMFVNNGVDISLRKFEVGSNDYKFYIDLLKERTSIYPNLQYAMIKVVDESDLAKYNVGYVLNNTLEWKGLNDV